MGDKKKWSLVALNRRSSYTVTIVREFTEVDSELVVLERWSHKGGHLNRGDCNALSLFRITSFV